MKLRHDVTLGWLTCLSGLLVSCAVGTAMAVVTPAPTRPPVTPTETLAPTTTTTLIPTPTARPTGTPISSDTPIPLATAEAIRVPAFKHIFLIVLENKEKTRIMGNASAPYFNQLAQQYASAANFHATRHPSLPNYLALTSGDTFAVTTDCTTCYINADNLASQLAAAGHSWKAYMESMSSPCFVGDQLPLYAQKHNPFIYYDAVRNDPALCSQIVPFTVLTDDLQANTVPDFVWITPNMCNSMHDCGVRAGDTWLQAWVPLILASKAWRDQGVLFITFDEGDTNDGCCTYAKGGNIPMLVISPLVKPGFVSSVDYDHYSLLHTIESAWGLPLLGHANCDCSPPLADFFATP